MQRRKGASLSIRLSTPSTYHWRGVRCYRHSPVRAWFYRPDEHSTGGAGFQFFALHACYTWGYR